jgi:hypothetical protein
MVPVTVAVRSEAWVLAGWLLGSWVRIPLKAWMFVRVFLCCVVLCRWRPCDGLITRPRSPTICQNSSRNLLYVRRPGSKRTVEPQKKMAVVFTVINLEAIDNKLGRQLPPCLRSLCLELLMKCQVNPWSSAFFNKIKYRWAKSRAP